MHLSPGAAPQLLGSGSELSTGCSTTSTSATLTPVCRSVTTKILALVPATRGLSIFSALGVARRAELAALLARPQRLSS